MKCKSCGANMVGRKCDYCGYTAADLFCKKCGTPLDDDWTMCPECGLPVSENRSHKGLRKKQAAAAETSFTPPNSNMRSKWVSFILCLGLGMFGMHKFYEGKTGWGVAYMLTFGFLYIGVIIDAIVILGKPEFYEV